MGRRFVGFLFLVLAIACGIYVGGWLCFYKAIVDIIEAVKAGFIAKDIAIGICKLVIGVPIAESCAIIAGVTGHAMLLDK